MKTLSSLHSPLALAAALAIAATAYPAIAQQQQQQQPPAASGSATAPAQKPMSAQDQTMMKLSREGFTAMRAIRATRIAIFNGEPKVAGELLAQAQKSLQAAAKDESALPAQGGAGGASNTGGNKNAQYVMIDGQIVLADNFVDTPAKRAHIDKANQNIASGHAKEARDELKLAEVDAAFTGVMMPLQTTQKHVEAAQRLMDQKKFYEANLALKAAEDGLIIDTVALSQVPAPNTGASTSTTPQSSAQQSSAQQPANPQQSPTTPSK